MYTLMLNLKLWLFGLLPHFVSTKDYRDCRSMLGSGTERFTTSQAGNIAISLLERLLLERKLRRTLPSNRTYIIEVLLHVNRQDILVAIFEAAKESSAYEVTGPQRPYDGLFRFYYQGGQVFFLDSVRTQLTYNPNDPVFVYSPTWWTPELDSDAVAALSSPPLPRPYSGVDARCDRVNT